MFAAPPTAVAPNVIEVASVTNALEPAPTPAADGNPETVVGVVLTTVLIATLPVMLPVTVKLPPTLTLPEAFIVDTALKLAVGLI